ncbi:MAG TPA: hypothetical protein VFS43_21495 [Polyangiaceae bacterium]|nr:hypothetical protein [Polyangiaceae bacterium]
MKNTWLSLAALALGVALSLGACGDDDDDVPNTGGTGGRAGSGTGGTGTGGTGTGGSGGSAMGAGGGAGTGGAAGTGGTAGQGGGGAGGAAGNAGAAGQGGAAPVSFSQVLAEFSLPPPERGCMGCHAAGDEPPLGGLVISYENLRNGSTFKTACDDYQKYVDTTDVNKSFLLAKLDPTVPLPADSTCGALMPTGTAPSEVDPALIALVRQWIIDGANP